MSRPSPSPSIAGGKLVTRRCTRLALALPALLLGGCAAREVPLPVPESALPAHYADATGHVWAPSAADLTWQDFIREPALRQWVELALAHNHELKAALLRVEEARAAHGIQRADRLPTLAAAFDAARSRVPADLNISRHPVTANQFQLGVGLASWELDLWGRVRSLDEAALQSYLASDAARRAVQLSVVAQVANGWLGLRELDERLALARRTLDSRAESLRIFRRRVELGATSKLELTQVELLWRQAGALLAQLEQARAVQEHALTLLVGQPVKLAASSPAPRSLDSEALFSPLAPGLPSDLLLARPDIAAAEHGLKASHASIAAARAAFLPRITLTSALGTASAELDGLLRDGSHAWTLAPQIALPLLDGGRRAAALDVAELRSQQALLRYEQTLQAAFRDVSDALAAHRWLGEQLRIQRATLALQTERARLAKLRYDSGAARYLEVLDAERDLLTLEQQLVQTQRAHASAQLALYAALGGGSAAVSTNPAAGSAP